MRRHLFACSFSLTLVVTLAILTAETCEASPRRGRTYDEGADSTDECRRLAAAIDKETVALSRLVHVTMNTYGEWLMEGLAEAALRGLIGFGAFALPHAGFLYGGNGGNGGRGVLMWEWAYSLGPRSICRATEASGGLRHLDYARRHRVLLDVGFVVVGNPAIGFVRPAYRYVLHPSTWPVGVGVGIGSTLEIGGPVGLRPSASPELSLHVGRCCDPGYWTLAARYDAYTAGADRSSLLVTLGISFF